MKTNKEYIEREALLAWAREFYPYDKQFASAVINAPKADVQEVVRCKDCKYSSFIRHCSKYECTRFDDRVFFSDDFCSYGVKMDKE